MSEVAKAAERNPASAAPEYPPYLEETRIEGFATVEFVVDTVGRPDSVSFRVIEATHPAFAESIRAVLSGMLFTPAEVDGHHVRQLVRQTFQFVIKRPDGQLATT
jgi:TonB family protein